MSALLGIDLGERRIGVALAEDADRAARPLVTIRRHRDVAIDAADLRALVESNGAGEIVVGLPLEAAGQEGAQAAMTRTWVAAIEPHLATIAVRITFQDERLSSHVAEGRLGPMRRGRSGGPPSRHQRDEYRARVDREAAAIILQDALDSRRDRDRAGTAHTPPPTLETSP
jgi:putative Holliday junction resolvase